MSRHLRLSSVVLAAILITACPSTPKPPESSAAAPAATPTSTPTPTPAPAPLQAQAEQVSPVTDAEVLAAQNAVARARDVDADYYDADNFDAARRLLDSALSVRASDPATAHSQLADATAKADLSLDNSVPKAEKDLGARMASMKQRLLDLQADKYAPQDFQSVTAGIQEASDLFADKDFPAGRARAWRALHEMAALGDALETREEALKASRAAAELAARDAQAASEKQRADGKQAQVMKALQDASKLTVAGEDGAVVQPRNWTENDLQKNGVLADGSVEDLLNQARQLWGLGKKENLAGNYAMALGYFDQALRYIEIYRVYAVKGVYTVQLNPDQRDSLWRIAGDKDVYGDPSQWPKIWRRNSKLIKDPDLILPGWQLVIPW